MKDNELLNQHDDYQYEDQSPDREPPVYQYLYLSGQHVKPAVWDLPNTYWFTRDDYTIYAVIPQDENELEEMIRNGPDSMGPVARYAHSRGCNLVMLAVDEAPVNCLPIYDEDGLISDVSE